MEYDKHLVYEYLHLDYKVCCGRHRFCKAIKQRVLLTPMYRKENPLHPSSRTWHALQGNLLSSCWNIPIGRNRTFAVPSRSNL